MRHSAAALASILLLLGPSARAATPAELHPATSLGPKGPVPAEWKQQLASIQPDPHGIVANSHYITSNEHRHEAVREVITDLGGVYIGIGTDQNYVLMGWSRPELAIIIDFDQYVVDVHKAYLAFFHVADSAYNFRKLWSPGGVRAAKKAIREHYKHDEAAATAGVKRYLWARKKVYQRLEWQAKKFRTFAIKSFLTDKAQYRYVARMAREGRVHVVRADLTGKLAMRQIGQVAKKIGLPVRTLYLSNTENYFDWVPDFRANLKALPWDDKSQIIRTKSHGYGRGVYDYHVQSADNLVKWLDDSKVKSVKELYQKRRKSGTRRLFLLDSVPPSSIDRGGQ